MLNRETKLIALTALLAVTACKTTQGNVANVDKARGEVELYSAGDKRTTLDEPAKLEEVKHTEKRLKAHLRKNRDDIESLISLAQVQVVLGDLESAEKNCKTALRRDLKNKDARKVLAQISMRRGNHDLAAIFLSGVGGSSSKDSGVLNMLALIELEKANNSAAMALFKRAIKVNPTDLAARMNLGVLLLKYRQLAQDPLQAARTAFHGLVGLGGPGQRRVTIARRLFDGRVDRLVVPGRVGDFQLLVEQGAGRVEVAHVPEERRRSRNDGFALVRRLRFLVGARDRFRHGLADLVRARSFRMIHAVEIEARR